MTREVHDIVLGSDLWSQLRNHLLPINGGRGGGDEQLAFILAAPNVSSSRIRLVGHELLRAQPTDLDLQSPSGISPHGQFVAAALTRCRREGWSLIEVHSHPFDSGSRTTFSDIDWSNDRMKMPRLASMLPEPFYHTTIVVGQNSLDAHYYQRATGAILPVQRVAIVGSFSDDSPVLRYLPVSSSSPETGGSQDERQSRQLPLLGAATQEALSQARVAVVGLGGLGSFVALELAYLGVGHLILIDPDRIELSNLNRLIGAGPADVGRHKVDVFRELIERLAPGVAVTAVAAPLLDSGALNHAKTADLLLGCVDSHGARLSLNHLSIRYLIPLIDAGTGARLETARPENASLAARLGGQVQVVAPGVGCLECRGFIHAQRAAYDLAPPEVQEYERAHGYGTEEAMPSVMFLNGVVASMQVAEAVRTFAAASGQECITPKLVVYDAQAQRTYPATVFSAPECATCGIHGVAGVADLAPLQAAPTAGPVFAPASLELAGVKRAGSDSQE